MKVIKKINNNFAVAIDDAGTPIIINGKGVGFGTPYELTNLDNIKRSYYCVDPRFINLISNLDESIIDASSQIVIYAEKKLKVILNQNLTFSLADHLDFAIKRIREGKSFDYGITFEMGYLHPKEMEVANTAVKYLQKIFDVKLPKSEGSAIAMHILEAENHKEKPVTSQDTDHFFEKISNVIEKEMGIIVDNNDFNYFRFITHIQYLLERKNQNIEIESKNNQLFEITKQQYSDSYQVALKIKDCISEAYGYAIGNEEILYLMLHINRLKAKSKGE